MVGPPENNQRRMKAAKVAQKKLEEEKVQVAKEGKQSKTLSGGPKRGKAKGVEGVKKKAVKKTDVLNAPREWWDRFAQYIRDVLHELRKVVFPSRKETIGSTVVVLVIVFIAAAFLGLVDSVLSKMVRLLVG